MKSSSPVSVWRYLLFTLALLPFLTPSNWAQEWPETSSKDRPLFPNLRVSAGATMVQSAEINAFDFLYLENRGATNEGLVVIPVSLDSDMEFEPGPSVGIALGGGMRMPDWLHLEVETGLSLNRLSFRAGSADYTGNTNGLSFQASRADYSGDLWQVPVLANATIPFKIASSWEGFGGLGIGAVFGVLDLRGEPFGFQYEEEPARTMTLRGTYFTATAVAQAFAGVRYRLNPASALSLSYRFRASTPPFWNQDFRSGSDEGDWELDLSRLYSHSVHLMYELKW